MNQFHFEKLTGRLYEFVSRTDDGYMVFRCVSAFPKDSDTVIGKCINVDLENLSRDFQTVSMLDYTLDFETDTETAQDVKTPSETEDPTT